MQVTIEDVSPIEKKLIVEVPWTTVDKKLAAAYRELARTVSLRGFRKGKVPRSVLQRMYGKHVKADILSQLVRESFLSAAEEHSLLPVSEPRVESEPDIKKGQPVAFEAIIEVRGEVEATDYDGMELLSPPVEPPEAEIDESLERLRQEHAELQPIEGRDTTARTDVVTISMEGTVGEHEIDRREMNVDLTDPERESLPGFVEALTGLPVNAENHAIELNFPEDHQDSHVAGKTANLSITITDVRKKELPELDDEFAKDVDRGETLAELRESIRGDLAARYEEQAKTALRKAALKELVARNQIPVAPALIERGVQVQFQQFRSMLGIREDDDKSFPLSDEMRENLRPGALESVRGELLLEAVAEKEKIEIDDDALEAAIVEMASSNNTPVAKLRAELARDDQMDNIKFNLRREKSLDLLIERGTVTVAATAEEYAEKTRVDEQPPEGSDEDEGTEGSGAAAESSDDGTSSTNDEAGSEDDTANDGSAEGAADDAAAAPEDASEGESEGDSDDTAAPAAE